METKICSKCGVEKELSEFCKNKRIKDGYNYYCKECRKSFYQNNKENEKKRTKEWRIKNKEKVIESNKKWQEKNKEYVKEKRKEYEINNKEKIKENKKKEYQNNKEIIKERSKKWNENNKETIKERNKKWRENNKEYKRKKSKEWAKNNPQKIKQSLKIYMRNKRKNDDFFKIKCKIRTLICNSFKRNGYKKTSRTAEIAGCTFEEFKLHIESQFEPWMNWNNHGLYNGKLNYGWDFDHIIPLSSAKTEEEVIKLNHYTNFQPLCSYINRFIKKDNLTNN